MGNFCHLSPRVDFGFGLWAFGQAASARHGPRVVAQPPARPFGLLFSGMAHSERAAEPEGSAFSLCMGMGMEGGESEDCCKWCLRPFSMPNPIVAQRPFKPVLQRRAPRSRECATCPRVISKSYPAERNRDDFESSLRTSSKKMGDYLKAVLEYERLVNNGRPIPRSRGTQAHNRPTNAASSSGEGRLQQAFAAEAAPALAKEGPKGPCDGGDGDDGDGDPSAASSESEAPLDGPRRVVEVAEGTQLEFKEELGVFWLTAVYEEHFGRKLDKKRAQRFVIGGATRWGIVLDGTEGRVTGCVVVSRTSYRDGKRVAKLHDSSESLRPGEHAAYWKETQKQLAVTARKKPRKEGEGEQEASVTLTIPTPTDFFEAVWGPCDATKAPREGRQAKADAPDSVTAEKANKKAKKEGVPKARPDGHRGGLKEKGKASAFSLSEQVLPDHCLSLLVAALLHASFQRTAIGYCLAMPSKWRP